ncbi:MAG: SAM-dependent methyltransferase [Selenomonadaceae bacterium]|nr:SAM-dependent methyltransferase [Selenomonadaceae bacterium]
MIDDRLNSILNFVEKNSRVADIGTDHGYLAIELAKKNICHFIIASDKNFGPVQAAKKNISDAGFEKIISVRQGDGLKVLKKNEVDTICIAGMGGGLICKILDDSPNILLTTENLILQPMNSVEKIYAWIAENNFFVADVDLAEAGGIIYEIIFAVRNSDKICRPTKKEKSPLLRKFLEQRLEKFQHVIFEMSKSPSAVSTEKFSQIENKIADLKIKIDQL